MGCFKLQFPVITRSTFIFCRNTLCDVVIQTKIQLDYENNICRFDLIPGKRKLLFNQKEQSIHAIDRIDN